MQATPCQIIKIVLLFIFLVNKGNKSIAGVAANPHIKLANDCIVNAFPGSESNLNCATYPIFKSITILNEPIIVAAIKIINGLFFNTSFNPSKKLIFSFCSFAWYTRSFIFRICKTKTIPITQLTNPIILNAQYSFPILIKAERIGPVTKFISVGAKPRTNPTGDSISVLSCDTGVITAATIL